MNAIVIKIKILSYITLLNYKMQTKTINLKSAKKLKEKKTRKNAMILKKS